MMMMDLTTRRTVFVTFISVLISLLVIAYFDFHPFQRTPRKTIRNYHCNELEKFVRTTSNSDASAKLVSSNAKITKTSLATISRVPNILQAGRVNLADYTKIPLEGKIECIPYKQAVHQEKICIIDVNKDSLISKSLKLGKGWEPHIIGTLKTLLNQNQEAQFLDVGSNIGVYALVAASMGRKVVAVEPLWENLLHLTKSVRVNKWENRIKVVVNAISDVYDVLTFWRPYQNAGGSIATSIGVIADRKLYDGPFGKVATIQLDNLLEVIDFKKAIMKIDIEGFEPRAFRGASRLFDQVEIKYVFMEWSNKATDPLALTLIKFFESRGYVAHDPALTALPAAPEGISRWPFDIVWVKK